MAEQKSRRKLAAILSADVVGYSKLMADDEAATVETISRYRDEIEGIVNRHEGRVVNAPGDNILAEFPSAVEAVQAAVEIQKSIEELNTDLPEQRRMLFRIGLNLGDVIEKEDGTIYGDGVNIAARMESLADTGGICVSGTILDAVEGKLAYGFDYQGEQTVKNIAKPVRVYRVADKAGTKPQTASFWTRYKFRFAGAAVLVVTFVALLVYDNQSPAPGEVAKVDDPALALPTGPSIAVLPFENMSGDPDQEYFSDGITEDIITRLTHFPRFFVIARNSTNQYKGQSVDVRQVGKDLGAQYVVEGSVRRAGSKVRVTAQLIDARDGTHMWAKTFDRDLTTDDLFQIQDEITEQVAGTIAGATGVITTSQQEAIKSKPTDSLDAYECVLRAIKYYDVVGPNEHREARDCLERAVKLDPNYADAWGLLAITYVDESRFGFNPRENSLDRALQAAQNSVRIDPKGEFGQHALAMAHFHRHELDEFHVASERAIENNPNHSYTLGEMADKLFWSGQTELGYALMKKAAALNPDGPGWYNFVPSGYHYLKADYDTALEYALEIQMPEFFLNHAHLATSYAQLGRSEEAQASIAKLLALYPGFENDCRAVFKAFNVPDPIFERYVEGFRKAGLNIPEKPDES
jgi:adenylate cyclase